MFQPERTTKKPHVPRERKRAAGGGTGQTEPCRRCGVVAQVSHQLTPPPERSSRSYSPAPSGVPTRASIGIHGVTCMSKVDSQRNSQHSIIW